MGLRQYSSDQPFFDKIPAFSHLALDNGSTEVSSKLQRSVTTSSHTRPKRAFSLKKKQTKKTLFDKLLRSAIDLRNWDSICESEIGWSVFVSFTVQKSTGLTIKRIGCLKVMLHGTIRNTALQYWNNVVTIRNDVATMLQRCVALKIFVANRLVWHHLKGVGVNYFITAFYWLAGWSNMQSREFCKDIVLSIVFCWRGSGSRACNKKQSFNTLEKNYSINSIDRQEFVGLTFKFQILSML